MYLRVWHAKRLALNYVQPQLVRAVTETGFEKRQLPPDTYRWLQAWYEEQKKLLQTLHEPARGSEHHHASYTCPEEPLVPVDKGLLFDVHL